MKKKFELYKNYQRSEIDLLFPGGAPDTFVGGAFLLGFKTIVTLATINSFKQGFSFSTSSQLVWSPKPGTAEADSMVNGQLLEPLQKAFLSQRFKRLLFASKNALDYEYLGQIEISSVGLLSMNDRGPNAKRAAFFHVNPKLSFEAWSRFGEFAGWKLTINRRCQVLPADADIEAALNPDWKSSIVEIFLTRYEGDCLHLVANNDLAVVMYSDESRDIGMSSRNITYSGKPNAVTHLMGFDNANWDTPTRDIVSKSEALELLKTFFYTGHPTGLIA